MKATLLEQATEYRSAFLAKHGFTPEKEIARKRFDAAEEMVALVVRRDEAQKTTLSDRIDRIVLHRIGGPLVLFAVMFLFYELSIIQGYRLTTWTWPILAAGRDCIASFLPPQGLVFDPLTRAVPLAIVDGIIAVLNYIPVFLILFALIAVMEDSGYMARVAFLLDRLFRYFGLHGHSAMPLILSGVLVGGCAVPGVMACRTIKDEKARLATMMIVPLMNCMAKIPLYTLLVGIFFSEHRRLAMFFVSTITLVIALAVAKIMTLTVLKKAATAPFVLELPVYHIPTVRGVLSRCLERTWLFVKKIITIVAAVVLVVQLLLSFPGMHADRRAYYAELAARQTRAFLGALGPDNRYAGLFEEGGVERFSSFRDDYRKARAKATDEPSREKVESEFARRNKDFTRIVMGGTYREGGVTRRDADAARINREYRKLDRAIREIKAAAREETINGSVMGRLGDALEPVTRFAGFNRRINIALISAFAAKENSVATLGSLYQDTNEEERNLAERMQGTETGWTSLHALALIIFMTMYPPCIPTLLMIRLESGSLKWTLLAASYPIVLGLAMAVSVFSAGNLFGLSGLQAMLLFYAGALLVTATLGSIRNHDDPDDDA